jgi:hypothetical protein
MCKIEADKFCAGKISGVAVDRVDWQKLELRRLAI